MKPTTVVTIDKALKETMKADKEAVIRSLREQYGFPTEPPEDSEDYSTDDEQPSTIDIKEGEVGRRLQSKILVVKVGSENEKVNRQLLTVGDIEDHLGVAGLVDALIALMKKEKLVNSPSAEVVLQYGATPSATLHI